MGGRTALGLFALLPLARGAGPRCFPGMLESRDTFPDWFDIDVCCLESCFEGCFDEEFTCERCCAGYTGAAPPKAEVSRWIRQQLLHFADLSVRSPGSCFYMVLHAAMAPLGRHRWSIAEVGVQQ